MNELDKRQEETVRIPYAKKLLALLLGVSIISFGCSLTIKINIGLSAWDALGVTISNMFDLRVGDVYLIMNGLCILIQIVMEGKTFRKIEYLQLLNVLTVSILINFFVYRVFANLTFPSFSISVFSYPLDILKVLCLALAYTIVALGVCIVLESKLIRNPLEGVCALVTERRGGEMGKFRQKLDIFFIAATLMLVYFSKTPLTLREGTVVCMLVFGPMLDVWTKPVRSIMRQFKILDTQAKNN